MSSVALPEDAKAATLLLRMSQSKRDPEGQLQTPTNISGGHHEVEKEMHDAQKKLAEATSQMAEATSQMAEATRQMAETARRWDNIEKKLKGTAQMPK